MSLPGLVFASEFVVSTVTGGRPSAAAGGLAEVGGLQLQAGSLYQQEEGDCCQ